MSGLIYYVYILKSLKNNRYYVGSTSNLKRRLVEHNSGMTKGNRYYGPFELVYQEEYQSLLEARRRELYIKAQKSRNFIESLIYRGVA
ncbi:MAG: GIY-YIG nuclease family protein [Candidatus Margulisiibacteriota bacterium]